MIEILFKNRWITLKDHISRVFYDYGRLGLIFYNLKIKFLGYVLPIHGLAYLFQ